MKEKICNSEMSKDNTITRPTYIIAFQLDMNEDDVCKIIQSILNNTKPLLASPCSISLLDNKFEKNSLAPSLDNTVNMNMAIKNARVRMWKALRSEPETSLSMERTNEVLRTIAKSKVTLVTLNIDLVDSTELSISLLLERLSTILQTFMQEVASVIISYGGYIKYIGDPVLLCILNTGLKTMWSNTIIATMSSIIQTRMIISIEHTYLV